MKRENNNESQLEKTVKYGAYGTPELKKEEKNRYLGEFKERVLFTLTYEDIGNSDTYSQVEKIMEKDEASGLVIDREVELEIAQKYIEIAQKKGLSFKRVSSPEFKGDNALVVVSDSSVNN